MPVPRLRQAVRAVVVDGADRVLLVRFEFPDGHLWAMPGGGVASGESPEDALRRELDEEVGLREVEPGPVVWERTHVFPLSDRYDGQHETFFLVRASVADQVVPAFSPEQLRAEYMSGSRWWTLDELRSATDERFAPRRLPELVGTLLADGPPPAPIDTGV